MTANDVSQLPPELTRAGRLDAIWYHTLPNIEERKEIFKIYFKKANRKIDEDTLSEIAKESYGYTGAEIEQIVKVSLRKAYKRYSTTEDKTKEIKPEEVLESIKEVIPIYKSSREQIVSLEKWAEGRARTTSRAEEEDYNYSLDEDLVDKLRLDFN